jgi:hypothetical protein
MAHVFIVALIAAFALAFGFALVAFDAAVRDVGSDLWPGSPRSEIRAGPFYFAWGCFAIFVRALLAA